MVYKLNCKNCEISFITTYPKSIYCSRKCSIYFRRNIILDYQNKVIKFKKYYCELKIRNIKCFFDKNDVDLIKKYVWRLCGNGYVVTDIYDNGKNNTIGMHRIIIGDVIGKEIDHINRNKQDNRKSNLRHVSRSENMFNKDNVKGIRKYKKSWIASIGKNRNVIYLGIFKNKKDAIIARKQAELKYYGYILK